MPEFRSPVPADRQWVTALAEECGAVGSECSFNNMYLWRRVYGREIARGDGRLLVRGQGEAGPHYLFPLGGGPLAPALEALEADAAARGVPLRLICLSREQRAELEQARPGWLTFGAPEDRGYWDYLYEVDRMADLTGRKLHAKRNHIHRFDEAFPDWMAEPITAANRAECGAMLDQWAARREGDPLLRDERAALREALSLQRELELEGVLIRARGQVVAFSLGSMTNSRCFDIHFEKAFGDIQGAYAAVNREMARMVRRLHPGVELLNREDDLGLEGLRRAKLSYYPALLLEKCSARPVR